ncbi:MAG: hypothetical protein ACOCQ4_00500 [bacterium]
MKYNFVFFASDFHCYETSYGDIIGLDNVRYLNNFIPKRNAIARLLYKIHHSKKINKHINLPLKSIWFPSYFKNDFIKKKPICFIFSSDWFFLVELGFLEYLKKKFPDSKFVVFFQDLIDLKRNLDINVFKKKFDLLISFDHREANKYNIAYSPLVNSKSKLDLSSSLPETDVYFLGAAKNRLDEIISAYEILKAKNLNCDFYITGVPKEKQKYTDEIHYINSMQYIDNLKHLVKSKSILEIMQKGGHGYTQRMVEAITYDKKIITNNPEVRNDPFYNSKNILSFKNIEEITGNSLFFENFNRKTDHKYKDEISPIRLLEFITNKISQKQ